MESEDLKIKKCTKCLESKEVSLFGRNPRYKNGITSWCKACISAATNKYNKSEKGKIKKKQTLKKWRSENRARYNELAKFSLYRSLGIKITEEEYHALYKEQQGCCAICSLSDVELGKPLVLDHCHETGKVRGFLCNNCNSGIGFYKDSLDNLGSALQYLVCHE